MPVSVQEHTLPSVLSNAEKEYRSKLTPYIENHRTYWSEKLNLGGTLTNIESSVTHIATALKSDFNVGCVSLQEKTMQVIQANIPDGWEANYVKVGSVMEHHAVIVSQKNKSNEFVFDPWVKMKPLVYSYNEWKKEFFLLSVISAATVE